MKKNIIILSLILQFCFILSNPRENRHLGDANWGTHMTPLVTCVMNTDGPVLEMGSGDFSTPLLHALCQKTNRTLLTTDTNAEWLSLFLDLETSWHKFLIIKNNNWDVIDTNIHWGVILIDHAPGGRRKTDIQRLRSCADILVIHDTQEAGYGYAPVISSFKYKYVYKRYFVETTVVSDTIDVEKFFK